MSPEKVYHGNNGGSDPEGKESLEEGKEQAEAF